MGLHLFHLYPLWHLVTRLGEAEILLPVAALTAAALSLRSQQRRLAVAWMLVLAVAATITTASKLAFIGWGIGWAAINFTGFSGHTMFASAVYPMLLVVWWTGIMQRGARGALLLGCALALLVGVSRIAVGAHSWSEVVAGWMLGGCASLVLFAWCDTATLVLRPMVPAILLVWLGIMAANLPASQTHSAVTALALKLSGHSMPYTRRDLLRGTAPEAQ
jgi:membrane-associated phospholipid phosphatase